MNVVVRCSCGGVQAYVASSIKTLGLAEPNDVYVGKEKIRKLASQYPDTNLSRHLDAISKKSGRYAFYITISNGDVAALYNLITGKKAY